MLRLYWRPARSDRSSGIASSTPSRHSRVTKPQLVGTYGQLPLSFEINQGQADPRVRFLSRGSGYAMFLTPNEAVLALRENNSAGRGQELKSGNRDPKHRYLDLLNRRGDPSAKSSAPRGLASSLLSRDVLPAAGRASGPERLPPTVLRIKLVGANPAPAVRGLEELPGKANYLIGKDPTKWHTNVPTFAKVRYQEIYPAIDLVYHGDQRQVEYDFIVGAGADPNSIALELEGAGKLEVDAEGNLVLHTGGGTIRQKKPFVYQEVHGMRREIPASYVLRSSHQARFRVGAYDPGRALVIDPVLFYSTYLGSSGYEAGRAIAVDTSGNAYVTGETSSTTFPTTSGAFETSFRGGSVFGDAFVSKLNPTGSALVYSTYLGGSGDDQGLGIAVDAGITPSAFVTGRTSSTDFPTTAGAFQQTFSGGADDAFVAKLDATGSSLVYSTYLGGNQEDFANAIVLDASGNAYLTGTTISPNFPTTPGAFDTTLRGGDVFVTKLNASGTSLAYSTLLGGFDNDSGFGIAVDASGNAYVTGQTASTDFPTTALAFQKTLGGLTNAFVTKVNPNGTGLVYSTYLGGNNGDFGLGIALDSLGSAYVTGQTESTNFPTANALQPTFGGALDAFVAKLDPSGASLIYSTYLGGKSNDAGLGIAVDGSGNAYVTGATRSGDFPILNPLRGNGVSSSSAFVAKLNPSGSGLVYSTRLGGNSEDQATGIALDSLPNPNVYIVGITSSASFPTTRGAFQTKFGGSFADAFVAKIGNVELPSEASGMVTGGGSIDVPGGTATFGIIVQQHTTNGPITGEVQYVNHASGTQLHSLTVTSLAFSGNTATFSGTCTNNGAPCTFTVVATDNSEPGTTDTFTISVSGGPTEGGTLRSGNIQTLE